MAQKRDRVLPPYLPWKTFLSFIDHVAAAKVPPPRIDTSMMPSTMSGQTRSWLRSSLRFLGLIDDQGAVGDAFVKLIEARGTDAWKPTLAEVITSAYRPIVDGLADSATSGQLNEAFSKAGVDGETKFKAVRFYVAALQAAGLPVSPFFTQRGAKTAGRRSNRRKTERAATRTEDLDREDDDPPPTAGMTKWPIPIPGKESAVILVPNDISEDDWGMIDTVVRAYIARAAKAAQD